MRRLVGLAAALLSAASCASAPEAPEEAYTIELSFHQPDGTPVVSPRITCFAGQTANVNIVRPVTYVKEFEVQVVQDAFIADPVVETFQEGLWLDLRVAPAADGLDLVYEIRRSALSRSAVTPQGDRSPKVVTDELAGARRLASGVEATLVSLPAHEGVDPVVVFARVTRVSAEGVQGRPEEEIGLPPR